MVKQKIFSDRTSAADKAIGFDYQYYYFLYRVLKLGKGQSVGLEVKDDVHTDLANDHQILIQLKHTTQQKTDGSLKNLTTFDPDLWKTLSNWSKVITDNDAGRNSEEARLDFIDKTDFMLVTNKSQTSSCRFFSVIDSIDTARQQLELLNSESKSKPIQDYIQDVLNLSDRVLAAFLRNIHVEFDVNEVIELCKDAIIEHHVREERVEQLFSDLDSRIRQDNFISIRNGEKIVISFSDFSRKYRRFFDLARSSDLRVTPYYKALPTNLKDQTFIKQLFDIGDVKDNDVERMSNYTRYMLTVKTNLFQWQMNGELTEDEVNKFNDEAKIRWDNKFRSTHRRQDGTNFIELALEVLDAMRTEKLMFVSQPMGTEFNNGEYYYLSDIPEIGWHHEWEKRYK
jgi:hypothetical protein